MTKLCLGLVMLAPMSAGLLVACGDDSGGGEPAGEMAPPPLVPPTAQPPAAPLRGPTPLSPLALDPYALQCLGTNSPGIGNENTQFPGVQGLYFYSDEATSEGPDDLTTKMCVDPTQPGAICIMGIAADSSNGLQGGDYAHWGAGVGLQLAITEPPGAPITPFDATAQGIAGFRLFIAGVTAETAPVRVQVGMVDDPAISESFRNLQQNAFLEGVDDANDLAADGMIEVKFADLQLPSWTNVEDPKPAFDASRIHSLQFQVVTAPDVAPPYSFCIADLEWFDAAGMPVAVPVPPPPAE